MIEQIDTKFESWLNYLSLPNIKRKNKKKILIIDCNSKFANQLKIFLEQNYFDVVVSNTGRQGIYSFIAEKPDLIILEIKLPDIEGLKVLKILNELKNYIHAKFICMSEFSFNMQLVRDVQNLGALDIINKKYLMSKILKIISHILNDNYIPSIKEKTDLNSTEIKLIGNRNDKNIYSEVKDVSSDIICKKNESRNENEFNLSKINNYNFQQHCLNDFEDSYFNGFIVISINLRSANQQESLAFRNFLIPIILNSHSKILIDLSRIEAMDAAFTGVLVEAEKIISKRKKSKIRLVIDKGHSTINLFIMKWFKDNFYIYDNLFFALNYSGKIQYMQKTAS